ncbi:MAG: hypothetical protein JSV52_12195 [Candidatus Zixiibacteriota bacterium]|nr:MAG: hypothetical protein JSV52_12195 [candidate division Zixibacteria bacterium]
MLLAISGTLGCSSTEVTGPEFDATDTASGSAALKIAITTDYENAQPETNITLEIPSKSQVYIEITNATGYHVRTLYDDVMEGGTNQIAWDGTNDDGRILGAGIYLLHAATSSYEAWAAFPVGLENIRD